MKKTIYSILAIIVIGLIAFITYIALTNEDNGKRKAIDGTSIDWNLLLDDESVPWILQIKVDHVAVEDSVFYFDFIKKFNDHADLISNKKKKGYSKVYVRFDKAGHLQLAYDKTKYDGKETTFYIKTSVIEENLKENKY